MPHSSSGNRRNPSEQQRRVSIPRRVVLRNPIIITDNARPRPESAISRSHPFLMHISSPLLLPPRDSAKPRGTQPPRDISCPPSCLLRSSRRRKRNEHGSHSPTPEKLPTSIEDAEGPLRPAPHRNVQQRHAPPPHRGGGGNEEGWGRSAGEDGWRGGGGGWPGAAEVVIQTPARHPLHGNTKVRERSTCTTADQPVARQRLAEEGGRGAWRPWRKKGEKAGIKRGGGVCAARGRW